MQNRYLEILELQPGATEKEVKKAYRRLAKIYHPDLSKDPNAQQRFVEINEAYNFLTTVGPSPHNETTNYSYNPEVSEYDRRRKEARAKARARAYEEIRMQQQMIKQMLQSFQYAAIVIIGFNIFLTIDWLLPKVEKEQKIVKSYTQNEGFSRRNGGNRGHVYNEIQFEANKMRIIQNPEIRIAKQKVGLLESTIIFSIPISVTFQVNGQPKHAIQAYSIYHIFGYMIPVIFLITFLYLKVMKTLDHKLTLALFMIVLFLVQLYVFSLF
ncbi:MAG: DnaJ domain-containing protein [Cyclobacteriaceae bacterium]